MGARTVRLSASQLSLHIAQSHENIRAVTSHHTPPEHPVGGREASGKEEGPRAQGMALRNQPRPSLTTLGFFWKFHVPVRLSVSVLDIS